MLQSPDTLAEEGTVGIGWEYAILFSAYYHFSNSKGLWERHLSHHMVAGWSSEPHASYLGPTTDLDLGEFAHFLPGGQGQSKGNEQLGFEETSSPPKWFMFWNPLTADGLKRTQHRLGCRVVVWTQEENMVYFFQGNPSRCKHSSTEVLSTSNLGRDSSYLTKHPVSQTFNLFNQINENITAQVLWSYNQWWFVPCDKFYKTSLSQV